MPIELSVCVYSHHIYAVPGGFSVTPALAELCTWICCAYGLDAEYLPQLRLRWAMGSLTGALAGYPPADCHRFRP